MQIRHLHRWDLSPREAIAIQKNLASQIRLEAKPISYSLVAGADISFSKSDPSIYAAVVILRFPDMAIIEEVSLVDVASFPYIPGLLAFREIPLICKAFAQLKNIPDIVLCDGQGIAHPRGMGLASHLGLILDLPTVGCAKTLLVGKHEAVDPCQWSQSSILYKEKVVGAALRTRSNITPMYISPGHRIDLSQSIEVVKQCTTRYRIPEPTRLAHLAVNRVRREQHQLNIQSFPSSFQNIL